MRHQKRNKKLNRSTKHRKALFKNLIQALILHEKIKTSEAKAKAIKPLMDHLISKAKKSGLHVRRQIMAFLSNKEAAFKLIDEVAPRFKEQIGGFTKLARLGNRKGDNTMMMEIELAKKKKVLTKKTDKKMKKQKNPKKSK